MEKHDAHKYKRIIFKKTGHTIFRCMLPGCPHFIRKELLQGRKAICWRCNEEFEIKNVELSKPHCDKCTKNRTKQQSIDKKLDRLETRLKKEIQTKAAYKSEEQNEEED